MFRFLQPLVYRRLPYHFRAYAVVTNPNQPVANALQNIEKEHERLLRVVEKRIQERKDMYPHASCFESTIDSYG